jgi:hypothetical protein
MVNQLVWTCVPAIVSPLSTPSNRHVVAVPPTLNPMCPSGVREALRITSIVPPPDREHDE